MGESIAKFMDRKKRRVARLGLEAEAAAHEAYGKAIRASQDLKLGCAVRSTGCAAVGAEVAR